MPSPPPSTILHESLTSGTETCFHSHSDFLFVLHVVVVYLFDFCLLAYTRFLKKKVKEILPLQRKRKEAVGGSMAEVR